METDREDKRHRGISRQTPSIYEVLIYDKGGISVPGKQLN